MRFALRHFSALVVAAALAMAGCAAPAEQNPAVLSGGTSTAPQIYEATVVSATPQPAGLSLVVDVRAGSEGCAEEVSATVTEEGPRTYIQVVYESSVSPSGAMCDEIEQRTVDVSVANLADREIIINSVGWGADGAGGLVKCTPPFGCDPPPADHCAAPWIELLFSTVEVLPEHSYDIRGCDGQWLILDLNESPDECVPPGGGSAPAGCVDQQQSSRWFAEFASEPAGWVIVASGGEAGCAPVEGISDFPPELCLALPAV